MTARKLVLALNAHLHLIEPLGFRLDDRELARAGMDYWRVVEWHRWVQIPMASSEARSLNLANCAALVLFEVLRQNGFRKTR